MSSRNAPTAPVLVDLPWLQQEFGLKLSRVQIHRRVANGTLPPPLKLAGGRSARIFWRRMDLERFFGVKCD